MKNLPSAPSKSDQSSQALVQWATALVFVLGLITTGFAWRASLPAAVQRRQPVRFIQAASDNNTLPSDCRGHNIPVVVLSHNNPTLVNLSVAQLRSCFNATVIILDLGSDAPGMQSFLGKVTADAQISVIRHKSNAGPHILFKKEGSSYLQSLPRFFAMTDPDLRLGDYTPSNFLCVLAHMTQRAKRAKAGIALDVTEPHRMWNWIYAGGGSIRAWEMALYKSAVSVVGWPQADGLVHDANVDTTLAVYDKAQFTSSCAALDTSSASCFTYDAVRLSGVFTAMHRPWYPEIFHAIPMEELQAMYKDKKGTVGSQFSADVYKLRSARNATAVSSAGRDPFVVHELMSYNCLGRSFMFPVPANGTPLELSVH